MKLLVDECLSHTYVQRLAQRGYPATVTFGDCDHAARRSPSDAEVAQRLAVTWPAVAKIIENHTCHARALQTVTECSASCD